ncbi:hypothetical protein CUC50_20350 [Citrobacter werkmanii]|nr:hypothetical protein CUC50_20350 [Citrobacter werkmanii]
MLPPLTNVFPGRYSAECKRNRATKIHRASSLPDIFTCCCKLPVKQETGTQNAINMRKKCDKGYVT